MADRLPATDKEPAAAVEVKALTRSFGDRTALRDVDFKVHSGEVFGLLGPNGGGKTTLFRILCTLLAPTAGTAEVFGLDVTRQPQQVRRCIGVVFQSPSLDGKLTAAENLRHQGHLYGLRGKPLAKRIAEMLTRMGVADRADDRVEQLSGGLRRRVELAKVFLHQPKLLLLDEPGTGLDPGARRDLWQHLRDLRDSQGVTVLLTTHIMDEAAQADRLGILDRGRLVALGSPDDLKSNIGGEVITIKARHPEQLRDQIHQRFPVEPTVLNGTVRIESRSAQGEPELIGELMGAFGEQIDSITVGKPTLEDVFIKRTGRQFAEED